MPATAPRIDLKPRKRIDGGMTRYLKGGRRMVTLRIDPALWERLDKAGEKAGKNRSEIIEQLVRDYLGEARPSRPVKGKR